MDIPIMLNGNQTNEKFSKWNRREYVDWELISKVT